MEKLSIARVIDWAERAYFAYQAMIWLGFGGVISAGSLLAVVNTPGLAEWWPIPSLILTITLLLITWLAITDWSKKYLKSRQYEFWKLGNDMAQFGESMDRLRNQSIEIKNASELRVKTVGHALKIRALDKGLRFPSLTYDAPISEIVDKSAIYFSAVGQLLGQGMVDEGIEMASHITENLNAR